jgi:hypothetical protein
VAGPALAQSDAMKKDDKAMKKDAMMMKDDKEKKP